MNPSDSTADELVIDAPSRPVAPHDDRPADSTLPADAPPRDRTKLLLGLFIATCLSCAYVNGPVYAAGVMGILLCHEFGHYLQALRYGVPASLPFFIPMPFSPLGTMGAVIGMSGEIPNRKALFDIGISGPLAGLVPSLIACFVGLQLAGDPIPAQLMKPGETVFIMPPILRYMAELRYGVLPPNTTIEDQPLLLAGWAGLFVTALNLIPIGQLDGGHILYAMLRRRSYAITSMLLYGALAFMILTGNYTFGLMLMLLFMSGPHHPPTHNDEEPLGLGRVILGWATLAFVLVGFTPVPIVFAR